MPSFKIIGLPVLEKILKDFTIIIIREWPSWSCDLDHLYKLLFPFRRGLHINLALIGLAVSVEKMFENGGHILVYSPGAGADNIAPG